MRRIACDASDSRWHSILIYDYMLPLANRARPVRLARRGARVSIGIADRNANFFRLARSARPLANSTSTCRLNTLRALHYVSRRYNAARTAELKGLRLRATRRTRNRTKNQENSLLLNKNKCGEARA